jgi:hypothetical protein
VNNSSVDEVVLMKKNILFLVLFSVVFVFAQGDVESKIEEGASVTSASDKDKQMLIEQLHICKSSLTKIIHHSSMEVYNHEIDLLLNNLRIKEISALGLYEVQDFREDLLDELKKLQLNEEERDLMKKINAMERDAMKWNALSNALSPTLLMVGVGSPQKMLAQLAFNVGVTAVRSMVEYKSAGNAQSINELKQRFEIRKRDLESVGRLRQKAMDVEYKLFSRFGKDLKLAEFDRTVEEDEENFVKVISLPDAYSRIANMENEHFKSLFGKFADYDYYLGMAYLDNRTAKDSAEAFKILNRFVEKAKETPLFRKDEKLGSAALVLMTQERSKKVVNLIKIVEDNLPTNGAALVQCAATYFELAEKYPEYEKDGLKILLRVVNDVSISDNKNLAFLLVVNRYESVKKFGLESKFYNTVKGTGGLDFTPYINYLWHYKVETIKKEQKFLTIKSSAEGSCKKKFRNYLKGCEDFYFDLKLELSEKFSFNLDEVQMYTEMYNHNSGNLNVTQYKIEKKNLFTLKELRESKAKEFFEANPEAIYFFVNTVVLDSLYSVKESLKEMDIRNCDIFRNQIDGCSDYVENLVKFWKEYKDKKPYMAATYIDKENYLIDFAYYSDFFSQDWDKKIVFTGDSLTYNPYMIKNIFSENAKKRVKMFFKIVFPNLKDPEETDKIILTYVKYVGHEPELFSIEDGLKIYFVDDGRIVEKI